MEIEKRLQKAHISKNEIPELCIDIGAAIIKLCFFEVLIDQKTYESNQDELNVNLIDHKLENREKLKTLLNEYFQTTYSYSINQIKLKDLIGKLHCCLFRHENFNEFMQKFNKLNLHRPFIVITGAGLVNHLSTLETELNARVIIISSENESAIRGVELLRNQHGFFYEMDFIEPGNVATYYKKPSKDLSFSAFHPALLVVIGKSTVYLSFKQDLNSSIKYTFLSSSAISGQTFFGLCNTVHRMTVAHGDRNRKDDIKTFQECVKMASDGQHDCYDSTLKHVFGKDDLKVEQYLYLHSLLAYSKDDFVRDFANTPVSLFGEVKSKRVPNKSKTKSISVKTSTPTKPDENKQEFNDFAAGVMNLVCYQIAETMVLYCRLLKTNSIVCAGTYLTNNLVAKKLIAKYLNLLAHNTVQPEVTKKRLFFLDNEAYLAAIGCMVVDTRTIESASLE